MNTDNNIDNKKEEAVKAAGYKKRAALAVFLGLIICLFSAFLLFGHRDRTEKMTTASGKQETPSSEGTPDTGTLKRPDSQEESAQTQAGSTEEQAEEKEKSPDGSGDGQQTANEDSLNSSGDGEIAKAARNDYNPSGSDDQNQENASSSDQSDQEAQENSDDPDQEEPAPHKTHPSTYEDLMSDIETPELDIPFQQPDRETEDSQDYTDYTEDQSGPEEEGDTGYPGEYTDDSQEPDDSYTEDDNIEEPSLDDDTSNNEGTDPAQETTASEEDTDSNGSGDILLPEVP